MTTAGRLPMNRRIVQGLLLGALCLTTVQAWSDQPMQNRDLVELEQHLGVRELLHCKSLVPETEESFVHIGGGLFAYFNRRDGIVEECSAPSAPHFDRIRFTLQELGYESRLVYRPRGSLVLKTAEGRTLTFSMEVLDYVQVSGRELPCYRLIANSDQGEYSKAILICCAVGTEIPLLVGTLYLLSDSGRSICGYGVQIRGRNSVEAENHLWKVVEVASRF
jgi:hypothetical protein